MSALREGSAGLPAEVAYLRKPVSLEQLEAALQQRLRTRADGEPAGPG